MKAKSKSKWKAKQPPDDNSNKRIINTAQCWAAGNYGCSASDCDFAFFVFVFVLLFFQFVVVAFCAHSMTLEQCPLWRPKCFLSHFADVCRKNGWRAPPAASPCPTTTAPSTSASISHPRLGETVNDKRARATEKLEKITSWLSTRHTTHDTRYTYDTTQRGMAHTLFSLLHPS